MWHLFIKLFHKIRAKEQTFNLERQVIQLSNSTQNSRLNRCSYVIVILSVLYTIKQYHTELTWKAEEYKLIEQATEHQVCGLVIPHH